MGFLRHSNNMLIALVIFSSFHSSLSSTKDTITSARFIRDHETITSNNSDFKLGFFSPGNSTYRYVGIWYLSESNILWVANRDQPLKDSSGVFKIHKDGNLVVLNGQNLVLWSTNVSINATNSTAQLEDSGNLVLQDDTTGATIWDTFAHARDTFIMGKMKFSTNRITGKKTELISWKSPSDPSTGYFTGTLELLDPPELFLWYNKTRPYWRSGPWNGRVFIAFPEMATNALSGWVLGQSNDGTVYLTYNLEDPSAFGIISLNQRGSLEVVTFHNKKEVPTIEIHQNECDVYGTCGPFGICDVLSSQICSCLIGFEPRNSQEWNRKNWTGGCVRKIPLGCDQRLLKNASEAVEQDGFLLLNNMKVPDFLQRSDGSQEKCRTDCLANCSCLAYAYDLGIGCMHWSRDLIDTQKFPVIGTGLDLYIRMPRSELGKERKGNKTLIIAIALGAIGSIALVICAYLLWRKWTAKRTGSQPSTRITGDQEQIKLDELPLFVFEKLAIATNNFHSANLLGKGGFGPVYKGQLEDGQEIAVKKLSKTSRQGSEELMNEVMVISKLQHRNLVKLLGCCIEGDEQMLVYEFMPNKSLDAFLFDPIQRKVLDWTRRFNIIEGIARGILYLHRDSRLRIIHRDLKASNILLDEKMNPKISDFGLARIFRGDEDDETNTRRVAGTYGYMPPEYAMEGLFSEKSDVYSFGVLLLEIISGRRNTDFYDNEQSASLVGFAWKLWNEDNIISLIDPEIWDSSFENSILRCIHIGLLCVQELAKERPTISTVVLMLISEITNLPPPKQVAFVRRQNLPNSQSAQKSQCYSINNLTLSEMEGR